MSEKYKQGRDCRLDKQRSFFRALKGFSWLTQLGASLVCPPLLCVFVAVKLQERFGMGEWIVIVAVVVGVLSSVCSFITFAKQMIAQAKAESQEEETEDET